LVPLAISLSCSQYEPFNSKAYLIGQYEDRVGPETAATIEVPYDLSNQILSEVLGRVDPGANDRNKTTNILDFVFGSGGLELKYQLTPTRSATETYYAREGNCLSFVNLFVGVARAVRLNPEYVEVRDHQRWNYKNGVVVSQGHIVAGMMIDGRMSTYDFLPYRAKSYKDLNPIDDLTATAHFYNNLGAEALLADDLETAQEYLSIATRLAPDFEKSINNMGVYYLRTDRVDLALDLYDKGLVDHPKNVAFLTNKARALQLSGRGDEAIAVLDTIEDTEQTSPFFFVYRADIALGQGDYKEALKQLQKAMRQDSEVPEVHIGLVKVYLAMGDTSKANHHVERALKLDATHQEARQYAAMLSRGANEGQ
jgi:tetratricopeptide (TPR) repeat protein